MRIPCLALAALATAAVAVPAVAEDLTVVYQTTASGKQSTSTAYYSADAMRTSNGSGDTIIEYGPGRIITVDHKRKEYSEMTLAEMDAALAKMSAKMQEQMANLPPAVRDMMGGGNEAVTLSKGGVRKVAGYGCQEYTVSMGGSDTMQVCATTAVVPPAVKVDYRKYTALAGAAQSPMFRTMAKMTEELRKIQGFTLAESTSLKMMGMNLHSTREATEIRRGPIPAATFNLAAIAPGYKQVPNPITRMH